MLSSNPPTAIISVERYEKRLKQYGRWPDVEFSGRTRIKWKSPYSLIVRPEVEKVIEDGSLQALENVPAAASNHEKTRSLRMQERGFDEVAH